MRALLDTNILVRHTNREDPRQPAIRATLDSLAAGGDELCICAQSIVEFWALSTRPTSANGLGMEPSAARTQVDDILRVFTLLPDPAPLLPLWLEMCSQREVRGRQAYDARLVALMVASGISRFVTLNPADFARYPMLELIVPGAPA